MNPTLENAIEIVKALPPPEREKFFNWVEEEKQNDKSEKEARNTEFKNEREKFRQAMSWLDKNRQKYLGQWVCLDGDRLVAHGTDAVKLYKEAKEKGVEVPFVEHITEEKEYGGGIEACPRA